MPSPRLQLVFLLAAVLPSAARAEVCTSADYPDLEDRLDCFGTFLSLIDTNMDTVAAGQATITGLISTQATRLNNVQSDLGAVTADYLTSADLAGVASEAYVDSAVAGAGGVPGLSDYLWIDAANDRVVFEGANVYIQSGSGYTDDNTSEWLGGDGSGYLTGLGNLIIGYDEDAGPVWGEEFAADKTGSHNLVVGPFHSYPSAGGLLGGWLNTTSGLYATVSGGSNNTASGESAAVSGGVSNEASGVYAAVSGGVFNTASGDYASVSGGYLNTASHYYSAVSGGYGHIASGPSSWVGGGFENVADGYIAAVSGGIYNTASGDFASAGGGYGNVASGYRASAGGGYLNTADGDYASAGGGQNNLASGAYSAVNGGYLNEASGTYAAVSGGESLTASGVYELLP